MVNGEKVIRIGKDRVRTRVEVYALDYYGGMLAALGGPNGYLELPAGAVDNGEDLIDAAKRETAEEAGWVVFDCKELKTQSKFDYADCENGWLNKNGFTIEVYKAVVCTIDKYMPDTRFNSEGDARIYKIVPIHIVEEETHRNLNTTTDTRAKALCEFRLEVLKQLKLFALEGLVGPKWNKW